MGADTLIDKISETQLLGILIEHFPDFLERLRFDNNCTEFTLECLPIAELLNAFDAYALSVTNDDKQRQKVEDFCEFLVLEGDHTIEEQLKLYISQSIVEVHKRAQTTPGVYDPLLYDDFTLTQPMEQN